MILSGNKGIHTHTHTLRDVHTPIIYIYIYRLDKKCQHYHHSFLEGLPVHRPYQHIIGIFRRWSQ